MKKRKYTHIKELEPILLRMREDGASRREIAGEIAGELVLVLKKPAQVISRVKIWRVRSYPYPPYSDVVSAAFGSL